MTKDIRLLDCTLRDGGYVNDWRFGNGPITCLFNRLNESGTDIIEIGFLDDRQPFDIDRTIQPDSESMDKVYKHVLKKKAMVVAMIDYGTCDINNVSPQSESWVDGIRVIFKKEKMYGAVEYGRKIIEKGYKLFLQMVSITSYSDDDIAEFCRIANEINPFGVSIVDTYGLMHKEMALHYYDELDKHLKPEIIIGYHSHNNLQLAYSNTIEFVNHAKRSIVVDGTLYGMGKSAGNAPIELLAEYLNNNYGKDYDIDQMLEAICNDILDIQKKSTWGYNTNFYLASKNRCHPNYVKYLVDRGTISIKSVDDILGSIEEVRKLKYDKAYIEKLYTQYVADYMGRSRSAEDLIIALEGKDLLLIGPGKSSNEEAELIEDYRSKHLPVSISVNFIPDKIKVDYVFLNNTKRYSLMAPSLNDSSVQMIGTSNITTVGKSFDYVLEYESLMKDKNELFDNALALFMNFLDGVSIRTLTMAGFDGFGEDVTNNYINPSYERDNPYDYFKKVNSLLKDKIREFSRRIPVKFITRSRYW